MLCSSTTAPAWLDIPWSSQFFNIKFLWNHKEYFSDWMFAQYRGIGEIGECICPLCWSIQYNFVRDGSRYNKREWACTPLPHQPELILPSWRNVRQKVNIATLCVLCDCSLFMLHQLLNLAPQYSKRCIFWICSSLYLLRRQNTRWKKLFGGVGLLEEKHWENNPPF